MREERERAESERAERERGQRERAERVSEGRAREGRAREGRAFSHHVVFKAGGFGHKHKGCATPARRSPDYTTQEKDLLRDNASCIAH